ncbi:MAG: 2-keto-4-pentenoate hydratase/2-oxohepta-3-ene-1,7-dioic acid hydratase in catechol pathway [Urechidicola sp.]|jgi:2-keto-4-pentenoate hydratase/2-oxohepta-3-ene-1,7-dioic acid hydratase in catechol pathway
MNTIKLASEQIAPLKIVCIGRNYLEHIQELGNEVSDSMVIFIKPNSSISNKLRSTINEPIHFEGEICFMVKQGALHAVGFGLDLTKRGLQSRLKGKGLPWERAKAFDGAACFSEFIPLGNTPIESLSLQLDINGKETQRGDYPLMIYKPQNILQEISSFMTLNDGDIIMTGTPKGVGVINPQDIFNGKILSAKETLISQEWLAE